MLVSTWDVLNAAIPKLQAQEAYTGYLVALASSDNAGKAGQQMAEGWRQQAMNGMTVESKSTSASSVPHLSWVFAKIRSAFGEAIRD